MPWDRGQSTSLLVDSNRPRPVWRPSIEVLNVREWIRHCAFRFRFLGQENKFSNVVWMRCRMTKTSEGNLCLGDEVSTSKIQNKVANNLLNLACTFQVTGSGNQVAGFNLNEKFPQVSGFFILWWNVIWIKCGASIKVQLKARSCSQGEWCFAILV